ncbi:crossover junction endonuclease EME1 [Rhinophrynus dorsalis]
MSSLSDSDSEDLPPVPFLSRRDVTSRPDVMVLSSDSDEEQPLPLSSRLLGAPSSKNLGAPSSKNLGGPASRNLAPTTSCVLPGAPQNKKGKKNPDIVTVLIDPGLLQGGCGGQVLSCLQAQDTQCVIQTQPVPHSITWSRTSGDTEAEGSCQEEADILVLVPGEEFVTMVQNSKKDPDGSKETLHSFVGRVKAGRPWKVPTLVIMEMEKYFKGNKSLSRKRLREAVAGEASGNGKKRLCKRKEVHESLPLLTRVDVEETLMELQLCTGVHVWFLETWKEFADFVCMFTKAVTEAPTKRQRDNCSFSFYLDGEWAGGVRVDRCGKGLLDVWRRQVQQFNRVSVEIASAVVAEYPSPQLLVQAYHRCHTEEERYNLLSDILVRRGQGVTSTSRRVGPEMSKRIYQQMMSREPELSLELS